MKVDIKSRYGDINPLERIDDFVWQWNVSCDYCRVGWNDSPDDIPFISLGTNLNFIDSSLPDEFIEKIWFDKEKKVYIFETTNIEPKEKK
jgi:hypothetical protein